MLRSQKLLLTLSAAIGLGLAPMSAGAVSITAADLPHYASSVDLGFAQVTASPTVFSHKLVGGYDVVGVLGGYEGGEIDLSPESITFTFTNPTILTDITVGALFAKFEEDDLYDEQALITAYDAQGNATAYVLSVTGATTATWTNPSSGVTNVSPATFGNGAVWSVSMPFDTMAVSSLKLEALGPPLPTDFRNNDYGFVSLSGREVPEPGTVALMGIGLTGLAVVGRKRPRA